MSRAILIVALLFVAAVNGLYSPMLVLPLSALRVVLPQLADNSPELALWGSSLLWALFTLMVSGIPVAVFERLFRSTKGSTPVLALWLVGAAVLTAPTGLRALSAWSQLPT